MEHLENKIKHTAIQLELLPLEKYFRDKPYTLIAAYDSPVKAQALANKLRGIKCAVRIEKDREGKIDVAGSYLVWARLKQALGGVS